MIFFADNVSAKKTAAIIKRGGLIIFPTETLYGLGCDATNKAALKKIYEVKNRPASKAFPILVKDFTMLSYYAVLSDEQKKIIISAKKPTNFVLKAKNIPPSAIYQGTAAFRISSHQWVKKLFRYLGKPLVATSANVSGEKPLSDPRAYEKIFGGKSKLIEAVVFAGINRRKKGSRIIDLTRKPFAILRP